MRNISSKLELGAEDFERVAHIVLLHTDGETERAETLHEKTALPSALLAFPISIAITRDDLPRQGQTCAENCDKACFSFSVTWAVGGMKTAGSCGTDVCAVMRRLKLSSWTSELTVIAAP